MPTTSQQLDATLGARQQIDDMRQRLKDEGKPAPLCLTNNMVRGLNKLFGISEAATEEFIRQHPSPFGD